MDQKRLLFAALLSMLVLLGWGLLFPPPERNPAPVESTDQDSPAAAVPAPSPGATSAPSTPSRAESEVPSPPLEAISADYEEEVRIETGEATLRFTNRGGELISYELRATKNRKGEPLEMVRARTAATPYPFALTDPSGISLDVNDALFVVERPTDRQVVFRYSGEKGSVVKEFRALETGLLDVRVRASGVGAWGLLLGPGLRNPGDDEIESRYQLRSVSYATGREPELIVSDRLDADVRVPAAGIEWFAIEDTYFLTMLAPSTPLAEAVVQPMLMVRDEPGGPVRFVHRPPKATITEAQEDLHQETQLVLVAEGDEIAGTSYLGAKTYRKLAAMPYDLEKTVRWGLRIPVISAVLDPLVGVLARWMLFLLLWIHDHVIANFGWSIVLLTVFIKLLLFPLTHKSYISMQKMQMLSPKIEAIKQKHRGKQRDKQGRPNLEAQRKMNEEIQTLFRTEGVNPAGGCLPILFQMPVFFALFSLLRNCVELWGAPLGLWIQDLSAPDPYYVLPIVMGAAQFMQQRITPMANSNPGQKLILNTMPIWFTVISFGFASGLVLYWLTNNLLTVVQQGTYQQLKKAGRLGGEPATANAPVASGRSNKERAPRGKKR